MKALEKARPRRYESANALARDVQRYLAGDAVEACPPTLGYRLRKAYRRNRAAVLTAGAFAAVLVAAAGVSVAFGLHAREQQRRAEEEKRNARQAADFFWSEVIAQASPMRQPDPNITLRAVVDRMDARLREGKAGLPPLVEVYVRRMLEELLLEQSEFPRAKEHLRW